MAMGEAGVVGVVFVEVGVIRLHMVGVMVPTRYSRRRPCCPRCTFHKRRFEPSCAASEALFTRIPLQGNDLVARHTRMCNREFEPSALGMGYEQRFEPWIAVIWVIQNFRRGACGFEYWIA